MNDHPLVTFALLAYKQEEFIREAVDGAFAQTYPRLEIILSDDCSPDHTYEIMQEMAATYKGPHTIRLNRNERNLGVCGHVNRLFGLAEGKFVVLAAGDDISLPERTTRLVSAWEETNFADCSVESELEVVSKDLTSLHIHELTPKDILTKEERYARLQAIMDRRETGIHGAAHGCSIKVQNFFGPLPQDGLYEDFTFTLRSLMMGGIKIVKGPLVKYRRHQDNLTFLSAREGWPLTYRQFTDYEEHVRRLKNGVMNNYYYLINDVAKASKNGYLEHEMSVLLSNWLSREWRKTNYEIGILSLSFMHRLRSFTLLWKDRTYKHERYQYYEYTKQLLRVISGRFLYWMLLHVYVRFKLFKIKICEQRNGVQL